MEQCRQYQQEPIPPRVVVSAGAALAVPVVCTWLFPDALGPYRPTLWLLGLIPVLRMAYWRGWRAAALAALVGLLAFLVFEIALYRGDPALRDPPLLPAVAACYAALALGITVLAHRLGQVLEHYRRGELLRRLEKAVQTMRLGVTVSDAEGRITFVNQADAAQHGYAVDELIGQPCSIYALPEHRAPAGPRDLSGVSHWRRERIHARKDGTRFPVELRSDVVMGVDGCPLGVVTVCEDVTEVKRAEREAQRLAEHERSLQEQLNQAQKMQAVGRLAGGVAHDFNNLLTVILSEAELAESDDRRSLKASLQEILKAGRRATGLTRQLLAFSRKEVVEPTVFGLNDLLNDMEKMIRRLVGEDIDVTQRAEAVSAWIEADRGQIEQVLMNLVVNARDAMPQGGHLLVETATVTLERDYVAAHPSVAAGRYVMLAVSDNGSGMSEEVQAHLFEPFFTTKSAGKGTGLGLATTYGIVAQAGGHIGVETRVGTGTTMRVFLPLAPEPDARTGDRRPAAAARGSETILLVEDDAFVRGSVARVLGGVGYRMLEAGDPDEALRVLQAHDAPLHLLLTDVVLPRMSGLALAERVESLRPEARILYVSGYTDDVMVEHGMRIRGAPFLRKPFTPAALTLKVREVLNQPPGRRFAFAGAAPFAPLEGAAPVDLARGAPRPSLTLHR